MAEGHCKSSYPAYVVLNFMPVPISKWQAGCLQLLACRTVDATLKEPTMLLQRTWPLKEQGDELKICVCNSAQGAFLAASALPGRVMIA